MSNTNSATKAFVEIENIVENVVILRNGALRAVLEVTSMNFDLKSADEQQGVIQGFQGFLNTIDFPLQIVTQSRKLDINRYLGTVRELIEKTDNELMRVQAEEYGRFVQGLSDLANIMTKKFYVVVPYYGGPVAAKGIMDKIKSFFSKSHVSSAKAGVEFEKNRNQLNERVDVIANAISGIGVTAKVLNQQELMNLYYGYYNFGQNLN